MIHLGSAAQAQASQRMAELNEAYTVLSHPRQRREYDEQLRSDQAPAAEEPSAAAAEVAPEVPTIAPPRIRARPRAEMISTVVQEFSNQVRKDLMSNRATFSWREKRLEGFDWGAEASFWLAHYAVGLRGFATADLAAAQKFTNYSQLATERCSRLSKKNFFLFLLPFQRISDAEQVSALCRRFSGTTNQASLASAQSLVVLLDVTYGRSVICGPRVQDKRFERLLQGLGLSRP
jgi:curved DNA-binding protein CbpA